MCVDTPTGHKIAGLRKVKKKCPETERLNDNKDVQILNHKNIGKTEKYENIRYETFFLLCFLSIFWQQLTGKCTCLFDNMTSKEKQKRHCRKPTRLLQQRRRQKTIIIFLRKRGNENINMKKEMKKWRKLRKYSIHIIAYESISYLYVYHFIREHGWIGGGRKNECWRLSSYVF